MHQSAGPRLRLSICGHHRQTSPTRCPAPGRGVKRKTYDFSRVFKVEDVGIRKQRGSPFAKWTSSISGLRKHPHSDAASLALACVQLHSTCGRVTPDEHVPNPLLTPLPHSSNPHSSTPHCSPSVFQSSLLHSSTPPLSRLDWNIQCSIIWKSGLTKEAAKRKWEEALKDPHADKEQMSSTDEHGRDAGLVA